MIGSAGQRPYSVLWHISVLYILTSWVLESRGGGGGGGWLVLFDVTHLFLGDLY